MSSARLAECYRVLTSTTKCRINEPSAPKSCQNLQYKRPCGDGIYKEYKTVNDRVVSYRENRKGSEYIHFLNSKALSSYFLEEEPMNSSIVKSVIKNNGKITLSELNQLESKMNDSSKRKNRKAKTLKY